MPPKKLVTCGMCQEVFDNDLKFTDHFLSVHTSGNDSEESSSESEDKSHPSIPEKDVSHPPLVTESVVKTINSKNLNSNVSSDSEDELQTLNTQKDDIYPFLETEDVIVEISSKLPANACRVCGDIKSNPRSLAYHILTHVGAMPYFCSPCSFSCISKLRFQQHIYNHGAYKSTKQRYWLFTKSNMHECEVCNIGFSVWTELVLHYASHICAMPFSCAECLLYFEDVKDYTIHTHIHKYTTVCDLCNIFFVTKARLLDHVLEHNKTKLFRKFRHIPWNEGLSPIRNPFSVLRADVYGDSFKQVKWYPESELSDSLDLNCFRYDTVRDFSKCDVKEEFIVYEDREDVGHLCEVLFEITDTDYKVGDFQLTPKVDFIAEEKDKTKDYLEKSAKVDQCENKSPKTNLHKIKVKSAISQKKKLSKAEDRSSDSSIIKQDEILNSTSTQENSLSEDSPNESQMILTDSQKSNREQECSESPQNISESGPQILEMKKFRILLQKLPEEVCDFKSFRRYTDKLRKKRLKLKWAKIKEQQNNSVSTIKDVDKDRCLITRSGRAVMKVTENNGTKNEPSTVKVEENEKKFLKSTDNVISKNETDLKPKISFPLAVNGNKRKMKSQDSTAVSSISILNKRNLRSRTNSSTHKSKQKCSCCTDSDPTNSKNLHSSKYPGGQSESDLHCNSKTSNEPKLHCNSKTSNAQNSNEGNHNHIQSHSAPNRTSESSSNLTEKEINSKHFHISNQKKINISSFFNAVRHDHDYFTSSLNLIKNVKYKKFSENIKSKKLKFPFKGKLKKCAMSNNRNSTKKQKKILKLSNRKRIFRGKSSENAKKEALKVGIVRVNLIRLPQNIYEKHLKMKPIMLTNILPLISKVESVSSNRNSPSQFFSSYRNSLVILEEHNYFRPLDADSDTDSTLTSFSESIMDFL